MNPIAIFRHVQIEGPGFLGEFLNERNIPWRLIRVDEGDVMPDSVSEYSGLVFMGGPMSVNDDLPWISKAEALIREAIEKDIPVLGHCLGGQLMSKALGGKVTHNAVKEIGWGPVAVSDNEIARFWFGDMRVFHAFHWHGETFTLPPGATHLLSSVHCANQAWAMGKHLAMQCHVEMTLDMIRSWSEAGAAEVAACSASPAVQEGREMEQQASIHIPELQLVATHLYKYWLEGVTL